MVADAVARCLSHALDKIDPNHEKCNPFSYLTQTCYNCFRQRIKNEKKFMKAKQKFREEVYNEFELVEGLRQTKDNEDDWENKYYIMIHVILKINGYILWLPY